MKERQVYLDAAKGIGMLLIVCAHTGVSFPAPMLSSVKVALFFLISGLFFIPKSSLPFKDYLKGDLMRIIVPFLVFYVFSYVLFYAGKAVVPGFTEMTEAKDVFDCFTQKQYFNGPIWFLLSLFWIRLLCYFVERYVNKEWIRAIIVLCVGFSGFLLGRLEINLPLNIDSALTFTPVFYAGTLVTRWSLLYRYSKVETGLFSGIFYLSCIPVTMTIQDSLNRYTGGGYLCMIYFCLVLCVAILFFSKTFLNKSVLLSFIGRNSMWIMCTHHLIYRPVKIVFERFCDIQSVNLWVMVATLVICCVTAPLAEKFIPVAIGIRKKK